MYDERPVIAYPLSARIDRILFFAVVLLGAWFAYYVHSHGLLLVMVDQYSHLSIARQATDSMTPGMSQLGFWPPLVHILMAPFAALDALYYSGFAAAFALVPVLALSAVFFFRLLVVLTGSQNISLVATCVYVCNPYMLYYAVTPMSDMLYVALVVIATYLLVHWWFTERLSALVGLGIVVSMATLARFEGMLLAAIAGCAIMYRLWRIRAPRAHIESVIILYSLLAGFGFAFILIYGLVYSSDPLAFMYNEWGAYAQQRSLFLPTEHNVWMSLTYLLAASTHMIGSVLVVMGLLSACALLVVLRMKRGLFAVIALMLASPFLFDILALVQGSAVIYVPELPPYGAHFFNERYGLYWFGFLVAMPAILAAWVYAAVRAYKWYYEPAALFVVVLILAIPSIGAVEQFRRVVCPTCFATVTGSLQTSPADHARVAEILRNEYDGGRILMTRALNNEIAVRARIPLKNYILEANEHYFDQAIAYPWLFAEWIVMQDVAYENHSPWSIENEKISRRWGRDPVLEHFYERRFSGGGVILYRLQKDVVLRFVEEYGIPVETVPSLSRSLTWDVRTTFAHLHTYLNDAEDIRVLDARVSAR